MRLVRWFDRPVPLHWQHVLFLGNIKGSLSMALALSLPIGLPGRGSLIAIVFGTVLVSLLFQGLSLPWMVQRLQLGQAAAHPWIDQLQSQLMTAKAAQEELNRLLRNGLLSKTRFEELRARYQRQIATAECALRDFYNQRDRTEEGRLNPIQRRLLLVEKGALADAQRQRLISDEVVKARLQAIDERLLELEDD
jgi:CPA1 family monovalent cation:H+ antiporter